MNSSGLKGVEIIPCAAYDRVTELRFNTGHDTGSRLVETGDIVIPCETIDNVTQGRRVTFIKMDIEGAERNALKGAEQAIRKYHPKLAICASHRRDDCIVLPEIIRSFWDGYRFYFRLHKPNIHDAVLYAVPPQD